MAEYTAPAIEKIADYSKVTRGSAIGVWRDYYGPGMDGRAYPSNASM